jgi:short-subunit dehydrogenase
MFKDKVVIITGASSGIGKALSIEFAKARGKVVLASRDLAKLSEVDQICRDCGADTLVIATDVSMEKDCENMVKKTLEKFGHIDVLVNNAGISMRALFTEVDLKVIKRLMDVNFWGTVYCTKFAQPYLVESAGTIVGVISIAGFRGLPARTGYSASKYAVFGLLETIRSENTKTGLNVLIVAPGFTKSNIRNTALTKDGTPQKESPLNESKLMSAEVVAKKTLKAIYKGKRLLILTIKGKLIYWLRVVIPLKKMDKMVYKSFAKEPDSPFK